MVSKIICKANNPPLAGLSAIELVKSTHPISAEWGQESVISFNDSKFTYSTENEILRVVARVATKYQLYGNVPIEQTLVDQWLNFSQTIDNDAQKSLNHLQKCLAGQTYLVGNGLTIADLAVFSQLYRYTELSNLLGDFCHVKRWFDLISGQPCVQQALAALPEEAKRELLVKTSKKEQHASSERKQEGKFVELPGAEMGKVIVRFPPEASGYLHIGHAKAALLNQYYQQAFNGKLIMRFDDTNPAKETVEFEQVILGDLEMLEIKPDLFTHTSQYFDLMLEYCEKMLKDGKAYVDDTEPEQMKKEREQRFESINRSNSYEKNFKMWQEMLKGSAEGQKCCVRAKIDMSSHNGCLRDPTIYRCKNEPHPRTGTKYKVYPTYDFACPIVDAIEGVTHTLRTMEYHDRDDQFYWFIDALKLRKPYIWEYSRLNMTNTVLSKRKLTWFVDNGLVDGWDDPRFPTVRGILRRGMTVKGLKEFIIAQGGSKSVVFMEWDKIWAFNKKVIDPIAPRYTALTLNETVVINVSGISKAEKLQVPAHPKNPDVGQKTIWIGPQILIDRVDANVLKEGENATFINWGNLLIKKVHRDGSGNVTSVEAALNLENKDYKKTPKLTWLYKGESPHDFPPTYCVYFDNIISKAVLTKEEDFKQHIGHETRWEVAMLGDPELKKCKEGDVVELQRRGFFRVDHPYAPPSPYTGKASPVILFEIPDGRPKEKVIPAQAKTANAQQKKSAVVSDAGDDLNEKISKQGNVVRDLKTQKAEKAKVDVAVKTLLALKAEYKSKYGKDWIPNAAPPAAPKQTNDVDSVNDSIMKQGNIVRDLKSKKAEKSKIDEAVKILLTLKADYKAKTGKDWTPGTVSSTQAPTLVPAGSNDANALNESINKQGNIVRELKAQKAEKAKVDEAVKILLALKADFKAKTGKDWTPGTVSSTQALTSVPAASNDANALNESINKQGNIVRELKAQKAEKAKVDEAVKTLLALKADFKAKTGKDWTPGSVTAPITQPQATSNASADDLNNRIVQQGNTVRDLKTKKAEKSKIDEAVKVLLALKADYKKATGKDWNPNTAAAPVKQQSALPNSSTNSADVSTKLSKQGDLVRSLKASKADKSQVEAEVEKLLELKAQYKELTGNDWVPGAQATTTPAPAAMSTTSGSIKDQLTTKITTQGDAVRTLKSAKANATDVEAAVKLLLELKLEYKNATGEEFPTPGRSSSSKKSQPKADKPKAEKSKPAPAPRADVEGGAKKVTRLGLEATKEDNLPEWYSQVLTKAELIEYYDVSGCYILRHWSFALWKNIQNWFTEEINKLDVKEVYFPLFVSKAALEKEKEHIADFSPEVAWVTKSGESTLSEPVAIRPTSETVMYPAFAKWVQSYRDLPIKINQWSNVVRWEFKHPQPFLRTREFLWQEGHTAYANQEDAHAEVLTILDLYARVYTDLMAIPVVKGRKTEKEKFAGGDYTTTVEAYISASGRAIQGATSHHLGQNFSKMFDIVFEHPETKEKQHVYQNSWGLTTRTIGVMIMVHADNKGLVLPPNIACIQAIIVPCGITVNTKPEEKELLMNSCKSIEKTLKSVQVKIDGDYRENYSPGWKFNHWELKGVPIRIEIGPKDLTNKQLVAVRRDTNEKLTIPLADISSKIPQLLKEIHQSMFDKANKDLHDHIKVVKNFNDFTKHLDSNYLLLTPFCGDKECESHIKDDSARTDSEVEAGALAMGAKSLCIPFDQPASIQSGDKCVYPTCKNAPKAYTLFGRSY